MRKGELKYYLYLYRLIQEPVRNKKSETQVYIYGRRKYIRIPEWFFKIEEIMEKITTAEADYLVAEIMDNLFRQGKDDKTIISELPLTESGYYRIKRKIEDKIYAMYIVSGDVTPDEILQDKIIK